MRLAAATRRSPRQPGSAFLLRPKSPAVRLRPTRPSHQAEPPGPLFLAPATKVDGSRLDESVVGTVPAPNWPTATCKAVETSAKKTSNFLFIMRVVRAFCRASVLDHTPIGRENTRSDAGCRLRPALSIKMIKSTTVCAQSPPEMAVWDKRCNLSKVSNLSPLVEFAPSETAIVLHRGAFWS